VFYVNELDGAKVAPGPRYGQIHDALVGAVEVGEGGAQQDAAAGDRL